MSLDAGRGPSSISLPPSADRVRPTVSSSLLSLGQNCCFLLCPLSGSSHCPSPGQLFKTLCNPPPLLPQIFFHGASALPTPCGFHLPPSCDGAALCGGGGGAEKVRIAVGEVHQRGKLEVCLQRGLLSGSLLLRLPSAGGMALFCVEWHVGAGKGVLQASTWGVNIQSRP